MFNINQSNAQINQQILGNDNVINNQNECTDLIMNQLEELKQSLINVKEDTQTPEVLSMLNELKVLVENKQSDKVTLKSVLDKLTTGISSTATISTGVTSIIEQLKKICM